MANRIEIQMALDAIKCANNMNDLLDCLSWQLQGVNPNDGGVFMVRGISVAMGEVTEHVPTFEELKLVAAKTVTFVNGYWIKLNDCFNKANKVAFARGLTALGVNVGEFKTEVAGMKNAVDQVQVGQLEAQSESDLTAVGKLIDENVPKLQLIRRNWAL